jgi:hypothetical protein
MAEILVGSVYSNSPRTPTWYSLQHRFLRKTCDYSHVACVNGADYSFIDDSSQIVEHHATRGTAQQEHLRGLRALVQHFRNAPARYAGFLILDSDAFPCSPGWVDKLTGAMGDFRIAAAVRHENLDVFAHPCALFALPDALPLLEFSLASRINLIGDTFLEIGCDTARFFPLLRSNRHNRHPIMGAVYWSSFYHHGAGSRFPQFRASKYHAQASQPENDESVNAALFDALTSDPDSYIRSLNTSDESTNKPVRGDAAAQERVE